MDPSSPASYFWRGIAKAPNKSALVDFHQAIELKHPQPHLVYVQLGMLHDDWRDYDAAIKNFKKAAESSSDEYIKNLLNLSIEQKADREKRASRK